MNIQDKRKISEIHKEKIPMQDLNTARFNLRQRLIWIGWMTLCTLIFLYISGCERILQFESSNYSTKSNGTIESKTLIISTEYSEYYSITYWSDGLRITGFFGRPKAEGVYPAVIYNRGGYGEIGALEGWEIVPFVETNYVAVASQYRGNAGSEGRDEFGGSDINDVINLVSLLEQLPYVDPERIGMMGHSRGGMMTYLALKHDTIFNRYNIKAAATVGGVSDLFMCYHSHPVFYESLFGGGPLVLPDEYKTRSATYWPELINVPLLIQHGEADNRVSIQQSSRLAELLEKAGNSVVFIIYEGDDHELTAHDGGLPEALRWFPRYLGKPGEDHTADRDRILGLIEWWKTDIHFPSFNRVR